MTAYDDPRVTDRKRRVDAQLDRERARLDATIAELKTAQAAAIKAADEAEAAELEAWAKFERTGKRRHEFEWQHAWATREMADRRLLNIDRDLRRARVNRQQLDMPCEFRRRMHQLEHFDALREHARARGAAA